MSKKRIVPCMDIKDGKVSKGVNFKNVTAIADPVEMARYYQESGADELVFYDIMASVENRSVFKDLLAEVVKCVKIPVCVGGGVKSAANFKEMLDLGVSSVSVNSGAIENPDLICELAASFPKEQIVFALDAKKVGDSYHVFSKAGTFDTGIDAIEWAKKAAADGAGELVINSIDTDGVKNGFDLELLSIITSEVEAPVIASGGAGKMEDFKELFEDIPSIAGGLAASVFHYKEIEINRLKKYLRENGINV